MNAYISDTHFDHVNIMKYCNRDFKTVDNMNALMIENLRKVEAQNRFIYHLGDVSLNLKKFVKRYGWLKHPDRHTLIWGNHDDADQIDVYEQCFGTIIGRTKTWRDHYTIIEDFDHARGYVKIMLSHAPQKIRKRSTVAYALYGHVHNSGLTPGEDYFQRNPDRVTDDYSFALNNVRYLNCCVEIQDYMPKTLTELIKNPNSVEKG